MAGKRIVFTGGTGKAGRHAVPHLLAKGYKILNVDLKPLDLPGVNTLIADLTDSGQAFNALTHAFRLRRLRRRPAAVGARRGGAFRRHSARADRARQRHLRRQRRQHLQCHRSGDEARRAQGDHRLERDDLRRLLRRGRQGFPCLPARGGLRRRPEDSYGLSKVCNEKTARAFAMRYGADIYALRIGNVIEPHEYKMFETFQADPMLRKRNAWSYIDARDLGEIVHLCLEKDGLGFQVFNATNDTITLETPTQEFLSKNFPQRADHAAARRLRGAAVEPQGARSAGLQGSAQLAQVRPA